MTTIHSYTGDQRIVDTMHSDLHRARAAATNMIPTSTGAAKAVGKVLPELAGKLDGVAIRVPTPNVSLVDLKFVASRPTTVEEVNEAVSGFAKGDLEGVLGTYDDPLVSSDFNHNKLSSVFSLNGTKVIDGTLVRIMSWYDNEWGFSTVCWTQWQKCTVLDITQKQKPLKSTPSDKRHLKPPSERREVFYWNHGNAAIKATCVLCC